MLEKFISKWDIGLEKHVTVCDDNYKIGLLINGYIAINYNDEYEKAIIDEIDKWVDDVTGGDSALVWIKVQKGKELEGLSDIVSQLVAYEDLTTWNNALRCNFFKFEIN